MALFKKESRVSDQELKDLVASLAIKSDRLDAQQAETSAKLNRVAEMLGNIGNNQGDVAEEFFYNSLKDKFNLAGVRYDFIEKNVLKSNKGTQDEFDIVMINGADVAIIEVKYKAHDKDLEKLLNKKYENFKILYPQYKNFKHHLVLAAFHINEELKERALEQGVIVLQRKGDMIETFMSAA